MSTTPPAARDAVRVHVRDGISRIPFPAIGQPYDSVAANLLTVGTARVLKSTFYQGGGTTGMQRLLTSSTDATNPSELSAILSTQVATVDTVLAKSKAEADAKNQGKKPEEHVDPLITDHGAAVDECARLNAMMQSVVGAKEGLAEGLLLKVGERIIGPITKTADDQDKCVDEWECYELINAVIKGAARPLYKDVLAKLSEALALKFDHRLTYEENLRNLRAVLNKLKPHGIIVGPDIIAHIILTEIEWAMGQPWGREIATSMDVIRGKYGANYPHDDGSIIEIMKELRKADTIRNLKAATAPDAEVNGLANSVVRKLLFDDESTEEGTAAASEGYSSDSSAESDPKSKSSKASRRDKSRSRSRSSSRRSEDQTADNNPCKHCRKHGRRNRHPKVSSSKCFWNKKYKGYRPKYVCTQLKIRYKGREEFPEDLGGYPSEAEVSSEEE